MSIAVPSIRMFSPVNNKPKTNPVKNKSEISFGAKVPAAEHIKNTMMLLSVAAYAPLVKSFGNYEIPVHNASIAKQLQPEYTGDEFEKLYNFAKGKGVFDYLTNDKTGLIKTSFVTPKENQLMSDLIWVTDSSHNMGLVKKHEPGKCTKILDKLTEFYSSEQDAFDNAIKYPEGYKHNGLIWAGEQHTGVGHCFIPETKQRHPWFPITRLESVGNYLQTASDMIKTGLNSGGYGYRCSDDIPDSVCQAVANCTAYLNALHYPDARSCGAWEEHTFVNSLTSDTSVCNQGIRNIIDLMYSETENKEILKTRERIRNANNGNIFDNQDVLLQLLKDGEDRIAKYPDVESPMADEYYILPAHARNPYGRLYDSAMAFMPQTETVIAGNIIADSKAKIDILNKMEYALVRENGAIRYPGDNYLKLDEHIVKNKFSQDFEAEWFLVSEFSKAYGVTASKLMDEIEINKNNSPEVKELLQTALKKQTEHINRSYARITPKGMVKSNGYPCPEYKVPEAYEAVTGSDGKIKYIPGIHPLTWAESSLDSASELFLNNLRRYEKINLAEN